MGTYNTVRGMACCPSCSQRVAVNVQFKFGRVWQLRYELGDLLQWGGLTVGQAGAGHVVVNGIAETPCPGCGYSGEWEVYVYIKLDRLVAMETARGQYDFLREGRNYVVLRG